MWFTKRASLSTLPAPFPVQPSSRFEGNDGNWSTFLVGVGTPQSTYRALVSTSSLYTWLTNAEGCPSAEGIPENCASLRGAPPGNPGWQRKTSSSTYRELGDFNFSLTANLDINQAFGTLSPAGGTFGEGSYLGLDTIVLSADLAQGGHINATSSLVWGVTEPSFFIGGIGIGHGASSQSTGTYSSMLDLMANTSQIPSRSWGFTAGASYRNHFGSLVLGGYDKNRLQLPMTNFSMPNSGRTPLLQVSVQSISITIPGAGTQSATTNGKVDTTFSAVIDSSLPYLYLPRTVCDSLERILGLHFDNVTELYTINATQRAKNLATTIEIIVQDQKNHTTVKAITLPYAAFDLNATWPIYSNSTSYFPLRRSPTIDPNGLHVLGRTYLQEAYIIADFERSNFTIAEASSPPSGSIQNLVAIHPATESPSTGSNPLPRGAIAGIALGAVVFLTLVVLWIWFFILVPRRHRRQHPSPSSAEAEEAAKRDRRVTVESNFTDAPTEVPSSPVSRRPVHSRQMSELSSDSEHERRRALILQHETIHELGDDDDDKLNELDGTTDTEAWIRNAERMARGGIGEDVIAELEGDDPALIMSVPVRSGYSSPRQMQPGHRRMSSRSVSGSGSEILAGTSPRSVRQSSSTMIPLSPISQPGQRTPLLERGDSSEGGAGLQITPEEGEERMLGESGTERLDEK